MNVPTSTEADRLELDRLDAMFMELRSGIEARFACAPSAFPQSRCDKAVALYNARRAREKHLAEVADLFGEPGWDLLLDLFIAQARSQPLSVSSACIGASCAPTTALRYLLALETRGHIRRRHDPSDRRRHFVTLAPAIAQSLGHYLDLA